MLFSLNNNVSRLFQNDQSERFQCERFYMWFHMLVMSVCNFAVAQEVEQATY